MLKNNTIFLKKDPSYCLTLKANKLVFKNNIVLYKYTNTTNINDPIYISQKWIVPKETLEYDKCRDISGWFKPSVKTYLKPGSNFKINNTYPDMIEATCYNKCNRDKNCDFYTINPINKHCSLYSLSNNSSIKYSSKDFTDSKGFGEIKNKSICYNNTIVQEEKNPEVNRSMCGKCAFPKFKDKCYLPDFGCNWQKCCPKGWNNSLYGAIEGKSCGAPYLYNKDTYDLWGDIVKNCLDADGTIELSDIKPTKFICKLK